MERSTLPVSDWEGDPSPRRILFWICPLVDLNGELILEMVGIPISDTTPPWSGYVFMLIRNVFLAVSGSLFFF